MCGARRGTAASHVESDSTASSFADIAPRLQRALAGSFSRTRPEIGSEACDESARRERARAPRRLPGLRDEVIYITQVNCTGGPLPGRCQSVASRYRRSWRASTRVVGAPCSTCTGGHPAWTLCSSLALVAHGGTRFAPRPKPATALCGRHDCRRRRPRGYTAEARPDSWATLYGELEGPIGTEYRTIVSAARPDKNPETELD
ncbi:hypothetical protein M885DRAFT_298094 [Pelagophyceae sp. CCMP2097]|nr:hypothetical protein M885DRAFT_298094 [Pelagophyceae sp. CCMP2097]